MDIGVEPPLFRDIDKIPESPCPFWTGKRVEETHLLTLIPGSIGDQLFTLRTFGELIKSRFPEICEGLATGFRSDGGEAELCRDRCAGNDRSRWVLMTRDVLEGSRNIGFAEQQKLVAEHGEQAYVIPKVLEAAVCILAEYAASGRRIFGDHPRTYTRCDEMADGYRRAVGDFSPKSLRIAANHSHDENIGIAALRRF